MSREQLRKNTKHSDTINCCEISRSLETKEGYSFMCQTVLFGMRCTYHVGKASRCGDKRHVWCDNKAAQIAAIDHMHRFCGSKLRG